MDDENSMQTLILIMVAICIFWGAMAITLDMLADSQNDINADRRNNTLPTHYEYDVISVQVIDPWIGENYCKITYIGNGSIISSINYELNGELELIRSNQSKFVMENPELNGRPARYILYWDGE